MAGGSAQGKRVQMRFIIYGVGAIGGTLAVKLTLAGHEVIGIARPAQRAAIDRDGLLLRTPDGDLRARFRTVAEPNEIDFLPDDVIFLSMKTQHTGPALLDLRDAGVDRQMLVCAQNGVSNEPMALRYFDNVFGAMVEMPVSYLTPGEVVAFRHPRPGVIEIGRYPGGASNEAVRLCALLDAAGFLAAPHDDIMRRKHGKLFVNLANGIDIVLGAASRDGTYAVRAREEARAVFLKAGIGYDEIGGPDPERDALMQPGAVAGAVQVGSSAMQSMVRGAGSVEVDYLNGQIAFLGRLHGVPTPVNAFFTELSAKLVRTGAEPGKMGEEEVDRLFADWQAKRNA